jgi:uncharacterized protein YmfQ (DUF2313 family)
MNMNELQQKAEAIAQWVIDNRYPKSEGDKLTDAEMYCTLIEKIAGCAPVGEAPQIDYRQFVKDYWCLLSTDMDKLDSIELTVTPHQLVAMLKEYAKGGEKYGTEASNTDLAVGATLHSGSSNAVEQIAQWVIDNRYPKSEGDKMTNSELYCTLIDKVNALATK